MRTLTVVVLIGWTSSLLAAGPFERPARTPVVTAAGRQGMVVSNCDIASQVGVEVLAEGGNAVDAAIAVGFALTVTWPEAGNIGGGGFMMVAPSDRDVVCIEYRETAPDAVEADSLSKWTNRRHERMVGVPGTVRGFWLAHQRYGTLPWKRLVEPAIKLASEGIEADEFLAWTLNGILRQEDIQTDPRYAEFRRVFGPPDKQYWTAGDRLVQPDLGKTFTLIAERGADAFYEGPIAEQIVAQMKRGDGWITLEDLKSYRANHRPAIHAQIKGYDFYGAPLPSSGGTTVLMELRMLETLGVQKSPDYFWSMEHIHLMTEIMKRAFRERAAYLGDADFVDINPVVWSRDHAAQLAQSIDPEQATPSIELAGDIPVTRELYESPQTTHFSVIDENGMGVSNTYTLEASYGSCVVVKGAGFLLNNEMGDFNPIPGRTDTEGRIGTQPNLMAPGKRMLSSQSPVIIKQDGKVKLLVGSPGGRTIINTVFEILVQTLFFERSLEDAVNGPRFHHQWFPDILHLESDLSLLPEDVQEGLKQRGQNLSVRESARQGSAHCIEVDLKSGVATGVADWRRGGAAIAVKK
ncbi:MAG: gamma-glutamyltransferase [Planctomycetaceae bacterium]|nr:gamma-glutamyltransferase [Planctomycetaceae bacterium]